MFDNVDDLVVFVEINQIEREEDAQSMNSLRRYDPKPLIELEPHFTDQSFEAREGSVGRGDTQA